MLVTESVLINLVAERVLTYHMVKFLRIGVIYLVLETLVKGVAR
jgi:hypothetical protein